MWYKKELLSRLVGIEKELALLRGEIDRQQGMMVIYKDVVVEQRKHIDSLLDRAMSRELKEYKTFSLPEGQQVMTRVYNPMVDEELAGRVVTEGELDGNSER
jgi:hypothetical protein